MTTRRWSTDGTDHHIQTGKHAAEISQQGGISNNTDVWSDGKGLNSSNVVPKNNSPKMKTIPKHIIKRCAYLCKENSSCKNTKNITIIYTFISNVTQTDIVGQVIATNVKSIIV